MIAATRASDPEGCRATFEEKAMGARLWVMALPLLLITTWAFSPSAGDDRKAEKSKEIPKEVRALQGTWTGSWTMFGIDDRGEVVKRMTWTDTMKAGSPRVQGGRAFVTTTDEMTFKGGKTPPLKVEGKEGYFLKKDSGLGDSFIEMSGQVSRLAKLRDNVWSYATQATQRDLVGLGFPKGATGEHVVVKVVGKEQGVETHRVSRLTTVRWQDKGGKDRVLQFISLQGHHRRQP
jgi:hypothetical protein